METATNVFGLVLFAAMAGAIIFFVVRLVNPSAPTADAPVPVGFHQRQRMELQEFYETYYLKPGSPIRMNEVQAGLSMFSMAAQVPMELLRPTDRLSDFGERSHNVFTTMVTSRLQQGIDGKPELAGSKLETVDDMIQLALKGDALPPKA